MPTYIKTGFWEKTRKGYKEWLNLDQFVQTLIPPTPITNIYNSDGTLTGDRILSGGNYNLSLGGINNFTFSGQGYPYNEFIFDSNNKFIRINNGDHRLIIDGNNNLINLFKQGNGGLKLNFANRTYELGQLTGNNATTLKIDDAAAFPVQVSGTNVTQNTSGASSGQFLKIKVGGVDYVIDLKNPS
jgi:hypothetical protein